MDKLVISTGNNIRQAFKLKRINKTAKNINIYTKNINEGIEDMTSLIKNILDADDPYNEFMTIYNNIKKTINLCLEYYEYTGNTTYYSSYSQFLTIIESLKTQFEQTYAKSYVAIEVPTYSTDIKYNDTSVSKKHMAELAFSIMFGYNRKEVDIGYATVSVCKKLFRIPPLGIFLFPSGGNDSTYWSNESYTETSWNTYFFNTSGKGIETEEYITEVRKNISYVLSRIDTITSLNSTLETYLSSVNESDSDDTFLQNLYNQIISGFNNDNESLLKYTQLLTFYSRKGLSDNKIVFVPPYFPTYNYYTEFILATTMILNVIITYFHNKSDTDVKYFDFTYTYPTLDTSISKDVSEWSLINLTLTDQTYPSTTISYEAESNSTEDITSIIFKGSHSESTVISEYIASNTVIKDIFDSFISEDKIKESDYMGFMNAVDILCIDPTINSRTSLGSNIPFRKHITREFLNDMLSTELDFPIAPYVGTNFINTWLKNNHKFENSALPQNMFEEGSVIDSSEAPVTTDVEDVINGDGDSYSGTFIVIAYYGVPTTGDYYESEASNLRANEIPFGCFGQNYNPENMNNE